MIVQGLVYFFPDDRAQHHSQYLSENMSPPLADLSTVCRASFNKNASSVHFVALRLSAGFFPEIFKRGGRLIHRHALDLTNVWDYFRNHGHGLLDHVHNYITCSPGSLKGGGSPSWPYAEKNPG